MTRTVLLILTGLLAAAPAQDTLYINGTADGKPKRLVIQDGKVVWNADPAKLAAGGSRTIDGAFIYPGLVRADSGHLVPLGADAAAVNPEICAGDGYDPFTPRPTQTASGITSV